MNRKKSVLMIVVLASLLGLVQGSALFAQPADFPTFDITQNGDTAPGLLIGSVRSSNPEVGSYFMIMDNDAVPVFYSLTESLGGLKCNGLFAEKRDIPDHRKKVTWHMKDRDFVEVDSFEAANGYMADGHDFQVLPNGHVLILIYDNNIVDMSEIVEGGHPAANVRGAVIQELDANKNVIFQWRSLDYIPVTDSYKDITGASIGYIHVNSVHFDPIDGNIILSCRETSEAVKISRVTGELIWRMTGKHNEFTFINEHPENAPNYFFVPHDIRRLANGHLTIFDNGNDEQIGGGRTYSRAVEYALDEVNKTATMVWEYTNDPNFLALTGGSATRLPNGNTIINWGGAAKVGEAAAMTEANPDQQLVYEIWPHEEDVTGGFQRIIWPLDDLTVSVTHTELLEGNTYVFNDGDDITGVTLEINTIDEGYNEVEVKREPFAPLFPHFAGKAPRVLPVRISISELDIAYINADIALDAVSFGFADSSGQFGYVDPDDLTIYYRATVGSGIFTPLSTTYNPVKQELQATMTDFGEFIIGFPDLQESANPPLLIDPADQSTLNNELPVSFFWSPRGIARYCQLQVATDETFTTPLVDEDWMTDWRYTWSSADPNTTYYYRVRSKVYDTDGTSIVSGDWSTASFQTVPPMIEVTAPVENELWTRGLDFFTLWQDNIDEDVVIDLYKGATMVMTIDTVSSIGAYEWEVDLGLDPGTDYSIKVSSSTDPTLYDFSETFRIDIPVGDLNGDGEVNLLDLAILAANYLK